MVEQVVEVFLRQNQGIPVVDVRGDVDLSTVPVFKQAVIAATDQANQIIINLAGVAYMDSSGFGTLLSANKKLRPQGGTVHLVGCNDTILRMLQVTRLNILFNLHASEQDALDAIAAGSDGANRFRDPHKSAHTAEPVRAA